MTEHMTEKTLNKNHAEVLEETFRGVLRDNIENTSRTFKHGIVDTTVSVEKQALDMEPEEVKKRLQKNLENIFSYVSEHYKDDFKTSQDIKRIMDAIWGIVNDGLSNEKKFRTHKVPYGKKIAPGEQLEAAMELLYEDILDWMTQVEANKMEPIEFGARLEFSIDNEIHPYADGCGKVTKTLSAMFMRRFGKLPPKILSREEYYEAMNGDKTMSEDERFDGFCKYYKRAYIRNNQVES